jgi:hypothetical protein
MLAKCGSAATATRAASSSATVVAPWSSASASTSSIPAAVATSGCSGCALSAAWAVTMRASWRIVLVVPFCRRERRMVCQFGTSVSLLRPSGYEGDAVLNDAAGIDPTAGRLLGKLVQRYARAVVDDVPRWGPCGHGSRSERPRKTSAPSCGAVSIPLPSRTRTGGTVACRTSRLHLREGLPPVVLARSRPDARGRGVEAPRTPSGSNGYSG